LPLLRGQTYERRRSFLIEYFTDAVFPRVKNMGYRAVRTERWKYIRYGELSDADELYDLKSDPYELSNCFQEAALTSTADELRTELERLMAATP
jgi:arylsulfatase A-like enzyme